MKSMPGTTCAVQNATCSVSAKKLSGIAVQHHPADGRQRHQLFGNELGRVEHVEAEALGLLLGEDLQAELPLRKRARLDRFPQIAAMEVRIGAGDLHRLVPVQRMRAGERAPVKLHERRLALLVDEPERVHAEALHHAIAARDRAVGHRPTSACASIRASATRSPRTCRAPSRPAASRNAARASPRGRDRETSSRPG